MTVRKRAEDEKKKDYKSAYNSICTNCEVTSTWLKDQDHLKINLKKSSKVIKMKNKTLI